MDYKLIFPSTLRRLVIALNGCDGPEYFQAGVGTIKPGHVVMEDDADEVTICTSTGRPIGVAGCDADHDLSTVYASGERIPVWMLGSGVDLYVMCVDATTITVVRGDIMDTADDTTDIGNARVKDAYVVLTTANVTANGTARNVTSFFWIGRALGDGSITSNVTRYVPVKLSL